MLCFKLLIFFLFEEQGFETLDVIRASIWTDNSIHVWLRQNALLLVKKHLAEGDGIFSKLLKHSPPLSMVHPEVYLLKLQQAQAADVQAAAEKAAGQVRLPSSHPAAASLQAQTGEPPPAAQIAQQQGLPAGPMM